MFLIKLWPIWVCFGACYSIFRVLAGRDLIHRSRAISWIFASLATGLVFPLVAETASAFNQFTASFVTAAWAGVDLLLIALLVGKFRVTPKSAAQAVRAEFLELRTAAGTLPPVALGLFIAGFLFIGFLGVMAATYPTTIWDCQTYHMPKAMYWIQQKNLHHWASANIRQVQYAPGGEIEVATTLLFCGDDQAANLSQWWACLTVAIAAIGLTGQLAGWLQSQKGKLFMDEKTVSLCTACAFIFSITVPNEVTQAVTTQNDLLVEARVVMLVLFGVMLLQKPGNWFYTLGVAGALALGVETKVTGLLYSASWMMLFGLYLLSKRSFGAIIKLGLASVLLGLLLNVPWMKRNYDCFGHPLSAASESYQSNKHFTPPQIISDVFRQLAPYTRTPFPSVTSELNKLLVSLNSVTGVSLEDREFIVPQSNFYLQPPSVVMNGDGLGNFFHISIFAVGLAAFLIRFKWRLLPMLYLTALFGGAVLWAASLRWQPWMERFQMCYFFLLSPVVGIALGAIGRRYLAIAISALLLVNGWLLTVHNPYMPIRGTDFHMNPNYTPLRNLPFVDQPREQQYFAFRPDHYGPTAEIANDLMAAGVTNVLLKTGSDAWEYPLWVFLYDRKFHGTLHHTMVTTETAALQDTNWPVAGSAVVCMDAEPGEAAKDYPRIIQYGPYSVCYRAAAPESGVKMIENQLSFGLQIQQPGQIQIHCRPLDAQGRPATNSVIRLMTKNYSHDYQVTTGPMDLFCPAETGNLPVYLVCAGKNNEDQHLLLSDFHIGFVPQ